ncbi:Uncharacterised protein [Salmonella enterica subsp. enterica]|uniref:Uncharacterized protein n=1 Tax=Salmonella enterica I TaxID=59201 RepID=A0A379WKX2_SALET|nr:Uncharacterised protein [Salmonella enterica subsp. enterica]
MLQKALCLGEMQGVRAGDINRLNRVALRHRFQRGKQMLDGIIICERLRLFKTTGVNGGEPEFAGFMGGVDKLARDPVSPNYSETYHKRQRTPERDFRQCSTPFRPCQCAATHSGILLARRAPVCAISPNSGRQRPDI